jgi:hypothetical protein
MHCAAQLHGRGRHEMVRYTRSEVLSVVGRVDDREIVRCARMHVQVLCVVDRIDDSEDGEPQFAGSSLMGVKYVPLTRPGDGERHC